MGYEQAETDGNTTRYLIEGGNAANTIDVEELPSTGMAHQGRGLSIILPLRWKIAQPN